MKGLLSIQYWKKKTCRWSCWTLLLCRLLIPKVFHFDCHEQGAISACSAQVFILIGSTYQLTSIKVLEVTILWIYSPLWVCNAVFTLFSIVTFVLSRWPGSFAVFLVNGMLIGVTSSKTEKRKMRCAWSHFRQRHPISPFPTPRLIFLDKRKQEPRHQCFHT